jgi:hypothetical protein
LPGKSKDKVRLVTFVMLGYQSAVYNFYALWRQIL